MTTLADMTEEERAQCRGMWCDFPDPDERTNLAIYVDDSLKHQGFCELIHEGQLGTLTIPENLTPRFDLPRAWNPDGQPVKGQWVEAEYLGASHGLSHCFYLDSGQPTHRYFETAWEPLPEED